jgi:hypothetical protein
MNISKLIGIVLVIGGALALTYGGFSYSKDTTALKLGPLEVSVKEQQTVNIPLWAGAGVLLLGIVCIIAGKKT